MPGNAWIRGWRPSETCVKGHEFLATPVPARAWVSLTESPLVWQI